VVLIAFVCVYVSYSLANFFFVFVLIVLLKDRKKRNLTAFDF